MNTLSLIALSLTSVLLAAVGADADIAAAAPAVTVQNGMKVMLDVPYITGGTDEQKLDLYLPEHAAGPLPIIILLHGGGWAGGDKKDFRGMCMRFVQRGYASATVNYRLAAKGAPVTDSL